MLAPSRMAASEEVLIALLHVVVAAPSDSSVVVVFEIRRRIFRWECRQRCSRCRNLRLVRSHRI